MADNYLERITRDVRQEQERIVREVRQEQQRIARETRIDQERIARETRLEQERISRETRIEQERIARETRLEQERMTRATRLEQERISRETRKQQERISREVRREQERIARETRKAQERMAREIRWGCEGATTPEISLSPRRFESREKSVFRKRKVRDLPISPFNEFDEADNDERSDTSNTYRSSMSNSCSYRLLACEFISSLHWPNAIFNTKFNRCYCSSCYKSNWEDVLQAGGASYVIPRDWIRLGICVDPVIEQVHDIWNRWHVTYHGTSKEAALSILKHRQFSIPGDQLLSGTFLAIRPGHIPEKRHIYTSPTIAYSSLPVYCPSYRFTSHENRHFYVRMVLECRQNPKLMHVQSETVGSGTRRICPYIPNSRIEYFTEARASLVAYGLLLHFEEYF